MTPSVHRVLAKWNLRKRPVYVSLDRMKQAQTADDLIGGVDPEISQRSESVDVSQVEFDEDESNWTYEGGSEPYTILIRQVNPNAAFMASPVEVSCSCPFWRYSGPEYHGKDRGYLLGDPRGEATEPTEMDPEMNNLVCKHVYRALQDLLNSL